MVLLFLLSGQTASLLIPPAIRLILDIPTPIRDWCRVVLLAGNGEPNTKSVPNFQRRVFEGGTKGASHPHPDLLLVIYFFVEGGENYKPLPPV